MFTLWRQLTLDMDKTHYFSRLNFFFSVSHLYRCLKYRSSNCWYRLILDVHVQSYVTNEEEKYYDESSFVSNLLCANTNVGFVYVTKCWPKLTRRWDLPTCGINGCVAVQASVVRWSRDSSAFLRTSFYPSLGSALLCNGIVESLHEW